MVWAVIPVKKLKTFAAGDMDKILQAVKLFDVFPLLLPLSSAQSRRTRIPTTSA